MRAGGAVLPKYTTPHMGGFFVIPCTPLGASEIYRLGPLLPQSNPNRRNVTTIPHKVKSSSQSLKFHPTNKKFHPKFQKTVLAKSPNPQNGVWPVFQERSRNPNPSFPFPVSQFSKTKWGPPPGLIIMGGSAFFLRQSAKTRFGFLLPLQNGVFRGGL